MTYHNKNMEIWGCFRCGAHKPQFEITPTGWGKCLECMEYGIVTFDAALAYMDNKYVAGERVVKEPIPELEDIEAEGFESDDIG